jgi:hypothetical protein
MALIMKVVRDSNVLRIGDDEVGVIDLDCSVLNDMGIRQLTRYVAAFNQAVTLQNTIRGHIDTCIYNFDHLLDAIGIEE